MTAGISPTDLEALNQGRLTALAAAVVPVYSGMKPGSAANPQDTGTVDVAQTLAVTAD